MSWRRRYLRFLVWLRRSLRAIVWTAVSLAVLAVAAVALLTRTGPGVDFLVREGLSRLEGAIDGSVRVEEVGAADLLEGLTLRGVALRDAAGREFVVVDSLRVRYSFLPFLRGDVVLDRLQLWGPRVVVERLPGQERTNASRILAGPSGPAVDNAVSQPRAGGARRVLLRDVTIAGGEVVVRLPQEDPVPEGAFTVPAPGEAGGSLREYVFRSLDAELPRVSLASSAHEGIEASVDALSLDGAVVRKPFHLRRLRGAVRIAGSSVVLEALALELPESHLSGRIRTSWGDEGLRVTGDLLADPVSLRDLAWLEPRLPEGRLRGGVGMERWPGGTRWRLRDGELAVGESRVLATGEMTTGSGLAFRNVELRAEPLAVEQLRPWVRDSIPLRGRLEGRVTLHGPAGALALDGELALREPGVGPTRGTVSGTVDAEGPTGVRQLVVDLEPFDYALVGRFAPSVVLPGRGSVLLEADGHLREGLRVVAEIEHQRPGLSRSRVEAEGTVRVDTADAYLDLSGDVDPLALEALGEMLPELGPRGEIEGPVRVQGRLGDLRVRTELGTERGLLALDVRLDARNPAAGYRAEGRLERFDASGLLAGLPEPTVVEGGFSLRGRGLDRESVRGEVDVELGTTRVGPLRVDTASLRARAEEGALSLDTLEARTNLARFSGGGRLGLGAGGGEGELRIAFANDSLASIEPFLFGDTVIAVDALSPLDREVLRLEGVDPDTLPTSASVALGGRLRGTVTLRGRVEEFDAEGSVALEEFLYGTGYLAAVEGRFSAVGLPRIDGPVEAEVASDSIRWSGLRYDGGDARVRWTRPEGTVAMEVRRTEEEGYRGRASIRFDSAGGSVDLEELAFRFDPVVWSLAGPGSVSWSGEGVRVRDLRMERSDTDAMRLRADGFVPFRGDADFELDLAGVRLDRVRDLLQLDEEVGGAADLRVEVSGTARSPVMRGDLAIDSLLFRGHRLSRLEGDVEYRDRALRGSLGAWSGGQRVAGVEGRFPMDLAFRDAGPRIPAEPIDLRVAVDGFSMALLASMVGGLEEVGGEVSGEFAVGGTPEDVEPSGRLRVSDGSILLGGLGIRPDRIDGTVTLASDGTATVELEGRSRGRLQVGGTVTLAPVSNPALDLRMTASGFQGVDRRDLRARLGGTFTLTGTYRSPVVGGDLQVEQGTLFIEEIERSAEVVDLSDPTFFDVVDTTLVEPVLEETESPFLRNLRVEVDVEVGRDTWLRSEDMNVEMGGEVVIAYDRPSGELVLVGQLNAIRGTYRAFGRTFQVREGQVEFVGTPGLNPNLSIEAVTRLRTQEGEPLTIVAAVTGTLSSPRVTLSSDAQPAIAQSDLASYLLFGRPSYALGSGESSVLRGQSALLGAAGEVAGNVGVGFLANQLGTVAQDVGLDYFAVTQGVGSVGNVTGFGGSVAGTLVEAGKYLAEDVFLALLLRPLSGVGSTSQSQFAGFRLEWRLADAWTVEGFVEERFTRQGTPGFGTFGFDTPRIFGFFVRRDWGY